MTNTINSYGVFRVSNHGGDPALVNVMDIIPRSLTNPIPFAKSLTNDSRVKKVINTKDDPAYHTEILQVQPIIPK